MTKHNQTNRKLAAILFADIVGYTALMQEGEGKAMAMLSHFEGISKRLVTTHRGEIIKTYGDGCLILFDSTVDAATCAVAMQQAFDEEPAVPVRIGIHVGEVIHKGNDVFGDGVNVASRIESIGMPGAVLLSASAQQKIRNQEAFETQSLGTFRFKNVREPIQVFAIANDGLVIPAKSDLRRSTKAHLHQDWHERSGYRIAVALILLAVILGLATYGGLWSTGEAVTISANDRQKRIAVLAFDDQTTATDLQSYGNMLSDWITRGLMETANTNVVSTANLHHLFGEREAAQPFDPEFAQQSGIDLLLQGRYYLAENRLIVIAEILDVRSSSLVRTFQAEGDRASFMNILDRLSGEVMSYWAVRDHVQFSQRPPKFEAYEEFLTGLALYTIDAREAVSHMENAFRIDTTFFPPLFRAWSLRSNLGQIDEAQEILDYLFKRRSRFTTFESVHYQSLVAVQEHRYLDAAKLNYQKFSMDPSDIRANFNAALMYLSANYPKKALETLGEIDQRLLDRKEGIISWSMTIEAFAHYRLGDYPAVHRLVSQYPFGRMQHALADFHMLALVRMDSSQLLRFHYEQHASSGVFGFTGMRVTNDQLLVNICCELMMAGKDALLQEYAQLLMDWHSRNKVRDLPHDGPDVYNNRPFRQEESRGYGHFFLGDLQGAIKTWAADRIPATNWPDILERASRLGYCYATLGDTTAAHRHLEQIASVDLEHAKLVPQKLYCQSRILAALGRHDDAVERLTRAIDTGYSHFRIYVMDRDPFLLPLANHASFQTLIRPKE